MKITLIGYIFFFVAGISYADSPPLDGIFISNSEKTIDWISHNNKEFYESVEIKNHKIKNIFDGSLIHKWKNGKLTVIASKEFSEVIKAPFKKISSNEWKITDKPEYTFVVLSADNYYVISPSIHGLIREYFDRKAEQGAAANP